MSLAYELIKSWSCTNGNVNSNEDILSWVEDRNRTVKVDIKKIPLSDSSFWKYDEEAGEINNLNKSFFSIKGLVGYKNGEKISEQPIIVQNEIGYLGIICKKINGVLNLLMQAKIEPGNINKIQISPTIQATKSNFTQKHGGAKPAYLEHFVNALAENIIVDQIQSEQSSRFLKKRNRNIMILTDEDVELKPTHKWMTIGQLKKLMQYDNLVNMDTRTVLSCIPYGLLELDEGEAELIEAEFSDKPLFKSVFAVNGSRSLPPLYNYINNIKMFDEETYREADLYSLEGWHYAGDEYVGGKEDSFKLIFCDIAIEGREVKQWTQPLFEATGIATFGLFTAVDEDGVRKFLVRVKKEVGCFDKAELAPTVQLECTQKPQDAVEKLFFSKLSDKQDVLYDTILSEEGGRFYHEQNRNVIIELDEVTESLPEEYFWLDYRTLSGLCQVNNCLNIQLRNLLSLLNIR